MRKFSQHIPGVAMALLLAGTCLTASAELPFSIPGLGKAAEKAGNLNLGSLFGNLTKATREADEPEEIRLGQEFAATLLGAKPLVSNPPLQRYINTLGRWLALQTERPDLPWTFGVLDDAGFNAFATPGGYIFVTRGLVERMRSEAELAGVLAHEIAHVLKKHHLRAVQKNAGFALVGDVLNAAGRGSPEARSALVNVGRKLYASGLDQGDEFEADRLGVVIAARGGFDPYGLPAVLQTLQAQSANDDSFTLLFKTHPAPGTRIEMLDALMKDRLEELPAFAGRPLNARLAEFRR